MSSFQKRCYQFFGGFLMLLFCGVLSAQELSNISVTARIEGEYRDVITRGEYAYVADGGGIVVLSLSNLTASRVIGKITLPSIPSQIAIKDDYLLVATVDKGLRIVNIQNPANPEEVAVLANPSYLTGLAVSGNKVYLSSQLYGLSVVDISDILSPVLYGEVSVSNKYYGVAVNGDYAYVSGDTSGVRVIDVSDPAHLVVIGDCPVDGHNAVRGIALNNDRAYLGLNNNIFAVFDVSSAAKPVLIGQCNTLGSIQNIRLHGDLAYATDFSSGVAVINISEDTAPVRVRNIAFSHGGYGLGMTFSGDTLFVAALKGGLYVYDVATGSVSPELFHKNCFGGVVDVAFRDQNAFLLDRNDGLGIYDISTPNNAVLVSQLPLINPQKISLSGDKAYISSAGDYFYVVNVSNLASPYVEDSVLVTGGVNGFSEESGYLYLCGKTQGVMVYAIDTLGHINASPVSQYTSFNGQPNNINIRWPYAFLSADTGGFFILDITNPADIFPLDAYYTEGYRLYQSGLNGNMAYLLTSAGNLYVLDIADVSNIKYISKYTNSGNNFNCDIQGSSMVVAQGAFGITLYDISIPEAPYITAWSLAPDDTLRVYFKGNQIVSVNDGAGVIIYNVSSKPDFYAENVDVFVGDAVTFVDNTEHVSPVQYRKWVFGDGITSEEETPQHVYTRPGDYSVTLILRDTFATVTTIKENYLHVNVSSEIILPPVKLFCGETVTAVYQLELYAEDTVEEYKIMENFMGLCSLSGDTVGMAALGTATTGTHLFRLAYSNATSLAHVPFKVSSYKIHKLPPIGLNPGQSLDFNMAPYIYGPKGSALPPSFGQSGSILLGEDTAKLNVYWLNDSTLRITALSEFTTAERTLVRFAASPVTEQPFGNDVDIEGLYVYPNLLKKGRFTCFNDIWNFGLEKASDKPAYPAVSFAAVTADKAGVTADNVMVFTFGASTQGIKMTPQFASMVNYESGEWYIARMKVASPTPGNDLQAHLYHYNGLIPDNARIDLAANIYFGVPTTWNWIETPLYSRGTGLGYPQIILKAGSGTGTVFLQEVQVIKAVPQLMNTRGLNTQQFAGRYYPSMADLALSWATTEGYDTEYPSQCNFSVSSNALKLDFTGAADGRSQKGIKLTAMKDGSGLYTPFSQNSNMVGMKASISRESGSFDSYNSIFLMACYGVSSEGMHEFYQPGGQILAVAEFGSLSEGYHYLAGQGRTDYYQFQYSVKNGAEGTLSVIDTDFLRDKDNPYLGDLMFFY
jgi:hypothetical protein